jgi:hypothetical protein
MRFVATSGIAKNSPEARPIHSILQSFHDQVEKRHRQSHSEFAVSPRARRETGDRSLRRVEFQRVSVVMNALSIAPTAPIVSASKHRNQGRDRKNFICHQPVPTHSRPSAGFVCRADAILSAFRRKGYFRITFSNYDRGNE